MNIDIIEPFNRIHISSNLKASAVHTHNGKLYVGFTNGDLYIYNTLGKPKEEMVDGNSSKLKNLKSFNDIKTLFNDNDKLGGVELDSSFPNLTKDFSSIERITCLPISNDTNKTVVVISTSESLKVYEIIGSHINLIQELEETRSVGDYLYTEFDDRRLFVVGTKKKLITYKIINKTRNILVFSKVKEISLKDKVRSIALLPKQSSSSSRPSKPNENKKLLLVGSASDFVLVDIENDFSINNLAEDDPTLYNFNHSTSFSYFGLSSSGPAIRTIPLTDTRILLVKDTQCVDYTSHLGSHTITLSPIKLPVAPIYISFINPLYLLVVYSKRIEIIDYESGDLIQKFQHQINSNQIYVSHEANYIYLASGCDILQFDVLGFKKQIDQYLSISGKGSSLGNIKDPHNDLKIIGLEKAISLVSKLDTRNKFFEHPSVSNEKNKCLVLRDLYKSKAIILFESYSKYHEALVEICSDWMISYPDVLELFPDYLNGGNSSNSQTQEADDDDIRSVRSFSHNVIKRISLNDIQSSKLSGTTESGTENELSERQTTSGKSNSSPQKFPNKVVGYAKSQNMRKFSKAVSNLIIYLTDQRRIHLNFLNDESLSIQWKGIEITPFDLYPEATKETIKSILLKAATAIDTSLFLCYFHTRPMLLGPLLRLPSNHCDANVVNECLSSNRHNHAQQRQYQQPNFIKELLDFYYSRGLHKDALEMLYKLSHNDEEDDRHSNEDYNVYDDFLKGPDLTIQYLNKLTNDDLDLLFQFSYWVIMEESDPAKTLKKIELIFMNDSYECESYDNLKVLNFFTQVLKEDEYGIRYLEWLLLESDLSEILSKKKVLPKFHTKLCLLYLKRLKEVSDGYSLDEFCKLSNYTKLYNFLETTNLYEPWTVLKSIPTSDDKFLRFTIFIYKRLGEHNKSIDVLFNQLNDLDGAIQYSCDIYQMPHSKKVGENLLHKLLEDLLMNYLENMGSIERLLTSQGSKMSILRVMTALPNSFPLHRLASFLTDHLRNSQETLHDARLSSQLYKVGSVKLQDKILEIESQAYSISSAKQLCSICNKRLGYSVFSVGKDNQIVHYGCAQRSSTTSTTSTTASS